MEAGAPQCALLSHCMPAVAPRRYKGREGRCRRINLLGGGTGITPLYQASALIKNAVHAMLRSGPVLWHMCALTGSSGICNHMPLPRHMDSSPPHVQVMRAIMEDENDPTELCLVRCVTCYPQLQAAFTSHTAARVTA